MAWSDLFKSSTLPDVTADEAADIRLRLGLTDADSEISTGHMIQMLLTRIEHLEEGAKTPRGDTGDEVNARLAAIENWIEETRTRMHALETRHGTLKSMMDRLTFTHGRGSAPI